MPSNKIIRLPTIMRTMVYSAGLLRSCGLRQSIQSRSAGRRSETGVSHFAPAREAHRGRGTEDQLLQSRNRWLFVPAFSIESPPPRSSLRILEYNKNL